jgi:hypothetical protein
MFPTKTLEATKGIKAGLPLNSLNRQEVVNWTWKLIIQPDLLTKNRKEFAHNDFT